LPNSPILIGYTYINEETQLPVQRRDLAGIIPVAAKKLLS
jgi:hypothetical protein